MKPEELTGSVVVNVSGTNVISDTISNTSLQVLTNSGHYIDYNQLQQQMFNQPMQFNPGSGTTPYVQDPVFDLIDSPSFRLHYPMPADAVPVARKIYPDEHHSVHKKDSRYFIDVRNSNQYAQEIEMDSAACKDGIYPEHLLTIAEDHLSCFEQLSEEQQQAVKHIKYAIAFLEKHTLSKK